MVYATVHKDRFDLAELVDILNQHGLKPDGPKMDHSLARLGLGFVLGRDDGGNYFYRVPLFREMIMKENPAVRLKVELDAHLSRARQETYTQPGQAGIEY